MTMRRLVGSTLIAGLVGCILFTPASALARCYNADLTNNSPVSSPLAFGVVMVLPSAGETIPGHADGGFWCTAEANCVTAPTFSLFSATSGTGLPLQLTWSGASAGITGNGAGGVHVGYCIPGIPQIPVLGAYWLDNGLTKIPGSTVYLIQANGSFGTFGGAALPAAPTSPPPVVPANTSVTITLPVTVLAGDSVVVRYSVVRPDGQVGAINYTETDPATGTGAQSVQITFSNQDTSGVGMGLRDVGYAVVHTPVALTALNDRDFTAPIVPWPTATASGVPAMGGAGLAATAGLLLLLGGFAIRHQRAGRRRVG